MKSEAMNTVRAKWLPTVTQSFSADGDYIGSSDVAEIANSEEFFKGMGQQFVAIATNNCYEVDSCLSQLFGGCMPIYFRKQPSMPANQASWRNAA